VSGVARNSPNAMHHPHRDDFGVGNSPRIYSALVETIFISFAVSCLKCAEGAANTSSSPGRCVIYLRDSRALVMLTVAIGHSEKLAKTSIPSYIHEYRPIYKFYYDEIRMK